MTTSPHPIAARALLLTALLLTPACGDDGAAQAPTAQPDAGQPDADGADMEDIGLPDADDPEDSPDPCVGALTLETVFEPVPDGPDTQIHAAAAYDGQGGIWLTFNIPEEDTSNFAVFATRLGCDGQVTVPPVRLDTAPNDNAIDPEIAVGADGVLVAWQADNGAQPYNLHTFARALGFDGTPVGQADTPIVTSRLGAAQPVNTWMPRLAPTQGGFVLIGTRGLEEAQRFQTFLQPLDARGGLDGEAIDLHFEAGVSQVDPAVALLEDGTALLAWTNGDDPSSVVHTRLEPGQDAPALPTEASLAMVSGGASMATDGRRAWLAFAADQGGDPQIFIRDASSFNPSAPLLTLGQRGRIDHSPRIAAGQEAVGVAWFRVVRGIRNEVHFQTFTDADGTLQAGQPTQLPTETAAPYQPAITHVGQDTWLVVWSEGTSPDFRLKAMFLQPR